MLRVVFQPSGTTTIIDSWSMVLPGYIVAPNELLVDPATVDQDFYQNFHLFAVEGGILVKKGSGPFNGRIIAPSAWMGGYPLASNNL